MTRLYEAAKTKQGITTQAELARALNISSQTVYNWEVRGISRAGMIEAQRVFGCSAMWLADGVGPMMLADIEAPEVPGALKVAPADPNNPANPGKLRIQKVIDIKLSAGLNGVSIELDRRDDGVWDVPRRWVEQNLFVPALLYAIEVKGDSMEPNYYNGDVVVINTADKKLVSGHVYAVNCEGEPVIKRVIKEAGVWYLHSDNPLPRYHKVSFRDSQVEVIGKIVRRETEHVN